MYFPDRRIHLPQSQGHLNPGGPDVVFDRFDLGPDLSELVQHVWVAQWAVPDGEVRPQRVLTYPAFNAVIEPDGAALYGPDPRIQVRELVGTSWVVGILFRAAAGPLLTQTGPGALTGVSEPLPAAPAQEVRRIMAGPALDHEPLVPTLRAWLLPLAQGIDEHGRLVNQACRIAAGDPGLLRAVDLAAQVGLSARSLERVVRRYIGMTPKWLIECRRLQQASLTLFTRPETDLSALGAELGYTDYPHFSRQYRQVLGETPETHVTVAG